MMQFLKVSVALLAMTLGFGGSAVAAPAPDANSVLILGPTVTGGMGSLEAQKAIALGYTPVVVDNATWGAMSQSDFASYKALLFGDPTCQTSTAALAAALANRAVWSPAVTGNKIVIGTDPTYHQGQGGAQLTESGIAFAAADPGTGMYMTLSCYYYNAVSGTPVPVLDLFGSFKVVGQGGCPADSHIVASHPALSGTTDATLSNWGCSTHEGFTEWPSDWLVLVISRDVPSTYVAPDNSTGAPYIIAQGKTLAPVLCGNGVLNGAEECDDGNVTNGDGCSAQCTKEGPTCGNGILEALEECDDGNTISGDKCSAACKIENETPGCSQGVLNKSQLWPPNHTLHNIMVEGITDPDGDTVTTTITNVRQDEPLDSLGDGATQPDAFLISDGSADIRAERKGNKGNGRVYVLDFSADDGKGGTCTGQLNVCVPHDVKDGCIQDATLYPSL